MSETGSPPPTGTAIRAADVKALRDDTGAGMMDCKRALTEAGGDVAQAKELLRTWGLAGVEKRKMRVASEGVVAAYLHEVGGLPAKVGVLVELDCETDFVAKTPEFKELARNIAMHVAALQPKWVSIEDVPADFLEEQRKIFSSSDEVLKKPEQVRDKIVEGKIKAIFADKDGVLLEQLYVRDETGKKKVGDIVSELGASVKENVVVRRFARFRVGEDD